jgi:hypothetical protein
MKLLFCGECGDVVAPDSHDMVPRWCKCGRHAVWWRNGSKGLISVHDKWFPGRNGGDGGKGWVIGIANSIMQFPGLMQTTNSVLDSLTPEEKLKPDFLPEYQWKYGTFRGNTVTRPQWVKAMLGMMSDNYIFKEAGSLVIRIAPGCSGDSQWDAVVPEDPRDKVKNEMKEKTRELSDKLFARYVQSGDEETGQIANILKYFATAK